MKPIRYLPINGPLELDCMAHGTGRHHANQILGGDMRGIGRNTKGISPKGGVLLMASLFWLAVYAPAYGDMGAIHISSQEVSVTEPAQKALVLFNGSEEVLMLETDLKASRETGILRFIPLPAKPSVELAPDGAFSKVGELVRSKGLKYISIFVTKGGGSGPHGTPVVEIISHKKLGSHDLTVIKVRDSAHFNEWVRNYFSKNELGALGENDVIDEMVKDYVERGISYFAFDFVKVGNADTSVAPLAYRFRTTKVYYPLKTSNSIGGEGKVQIFFLAPNRVGDPMQSAYVLERFHFQGATGSVGFDHFQVSTYAPLKPKEAEGIYPGIEKFFEDIPVVLQCASYSGPLSFKEDVWLPMFEQYNPAEDLLPGGDPAGLKPDSGESSDDIFQHGFPPPGRVNRALEKAERAEAEKHSLYKAVLNGPLFVSLDKRTVRLKEGEWEDGGMQVKLRLLTIGDLTGDNLPDAAVLYTVFKDGKTTRELSVLKGKMQGGILTAQEPQSGLTITVGPGEIRAMSISNGTIHLKPGGSAPVNYAVRGERLGRISKSLKDSRVR
jgi:hypothetical protein